VNRTLSRRAAIVGIGQTEFSKASGRSELQLACECVKPALDDAGLAPGDVDGLVTFSMDSSDETEVARNLGIPMLSLFTRVPYGGGAACGVVMQAAMASEVLVRHAVLVHVAPRVQRDPPRGRQQAEGAVPVEPRRQHRGRHARPAEAHAVRAFPDGTRSRYLDPLLDAGSGCRLSSETR
jgi:hypothetical protein